MAYKNQKKNKAHIKTLQNKDWRLSNKKAANYRKASTSNKQMTQMDMEFLLRSNNLI